MYIPFLWNEGKYLIIELRGDGMTTVLLCYLLAMNLIAFFAMGIDKKKAKKEGARRIPERTLLGLAAVGGSVGAICGMRLFRHKTLHNQFRYGLPAILVLQLALAGFLVWKFVLT